MDTTPGPSPQFIAIAAAVGLFALAFCVGMAALGWSVSSAARAQDAAEQAITDAIEDQVEQSDDLQRQLEQMERDLRNPPATPAADPAPTTSSVATAQPGELIVTGSLDKDLVEAVIKRNTNQLRYCYQRELTKKPTLAGDVTVKFTISPDGSVSAATVAATTLNNPNVESCLISRFTRFSYPMPKGGGIVIVEYSMVFAPG